MNLKQKILDDIKECIFDRKKKSKKKSDKNQNNCKTTGASGKTECDKDKKKNKIDCCKNKDKSKKECKLKGKKITVIIKCDNYKVHHAPPPNVFCAGARKTEWIVLNRVRKRKRTKNGAGTVKKLELFEARLTSHPLNANEKNLLVKNLTIPGLNNVGNKSQPDNFVISYLPNGDINAAAVRARIEYINLYFYKGDSKSNKINLHHLRPVWASGRDIGKNLWPVPPFHQDAMNYEKLKEMSSLSITLQARDPKKNYDSMHHWWNANVFWAFNKQLTKKQKCYLKLAPNPKIKHTPAPGLIGSYTERTMPSVATKLEKIKIRLYINFICDDYCKNWRIR